MQLTERGCYHYADFGHAKSVVFDLRHLLCMCAPLYSANISLSRGMVYVSMRVKKIAKGI